MKRKLISVLLLVFTLMLCLTGCGKDNNTNNNSRKEEKTKEEKTVSSIQNIRDNSIYYVIINGKKIKVGDKISSLETLNLKLKDKDLDTKIPKKQIFNG